MAGRSVRQAKRCAGANLNGKQAHLGVLQRVVAAFAMVMRYVMGTSGAESLAAAVNMFVGQDESALFIRPYLEALTRSEVMSLMTVGMGTIASGILVTYTCSAHSLFGWESRDRTSPPSARCLAKG